MGAGRSRLTWLWAGHCGHPAGGQGHSARPRCSRSRRAPGPGKAREGWLGGPSAAGHPSPPQYTILDMGFVFSALLRHHPAVPHAFAETTPFFKIWLKLGFSRVPFSSQLSSSFGWYPPPQQGDCSPCLQISCAGGKVLGSGGAGGERHSFCSQLMGKIGT